MKRNTQRKAKNGKKVKERKEKAKRLKELIDDEDTVSEGGKEGKIERK